MSFWTYDKIRGNLGALVASRVGTDPEPSGYLSVDHKAKWVVVSDPLPTHEGGYSPGASFTHIDIDHGLRYGSFSPGTVVANSEGQQYEIRRREAKLWLWNLERDKWALRSEW